MSPARGEVLIGMSVRLHLLLFLGFVAIAVISAAFVQSSAEKVALPMASSYSTAPEGCKALYLLLEGLKLPVSRFRKSCRFLDPHSGALIVVDPKRVPFSSHELARLEKWIKRGNTLIFFQGRPSRATRKESGRSEREQAGTRSYFSARRALERRFGLRVKTFANVSRSTLRVSSPQLDGVDELDVSKTLRWASAPRGWNVLAGDGAGPIVLSKTMGMGEIIAVSDPTLVQNRFISQAQNVRLLPALLLGKVRPAGVFFDEYHHGHLVSESFWGYVWSSVFAVIMFQSVVFFGLFFYSRRASRSGRFRFLTRRVGRSSLEHVDSMAGVFASCKAGSVALEAVLRRFLSKLSRKTGVPAKSLEQAGPDDRLFGAAMAKEVSDLVKECREAIRFNDESDRVVQLGRRLAEAQSKLGDGLPKAATSQRALR